MVKQLLKVPIWLPHNLDPKVAFKKMWAAKSLCSVQMQLLHLKKGRLCSYMFPKTQQFWIGVLNNCTTTVSHNRVEFQVSKLNDKHSIVDTRMATSAEETKATAGKSPSEVCDGSQHSLEAKMKRINLSFAACGFLGIYHLGAAAAFCKHGKKLLKVVKAFAGASAGSLAASVLLTVPENIEKSKQFAYGFAEEVRKLDFGAVTPGYDFMKTLREGIESILPSNAHEIAENRLYVSVTNTKTGENHLVSNFASREDLIKVLLASSFVPLYAGIKPVEYKGETVRLNAPSASLQMTASSRCLVLSINQRNRMSSRGFWTSWRGGPRPFLASSRPTLTSQNHQGWKRPQRPSSPTHYHRPHD
ncbi:patatin-like phospholipase domain-containing protein 4 isoform X2 [Melanerpes formicivorus]|uniref:patatin-like phospholipase domain-containing protein 4 isoform X2 n=1 Tax=Melanerpes formicivorus TaxID=211600 RepID=UPI00358EB7C1